MSTAENKAIAFPGVKDGETFTIAGFVPSDDPVADFIPPKDFIHHLQGRGMARPVKRKEKKHGSRAGRLQAQYGNIECKVSRS